MAPGDKRGRRLSDGGMTRLREAEGKAQLLEVGMGGGVFGCVCISGLYCYLLVSYLSSHCTFVPCLTPTTNSKEELAAAKRAAEEAEAQLAEARAAAAQAVSTQSQLQVGFC